MIDDCLPRLPALTKVATAAPSSGIEANSTTETPETPENRAIATRVRMIEPILSQKTQRSKVRVVVSHDVMIIP